MMPSKPKPKKFSFKSHGEVPWLLADYVMAISSCDEFVDNNMAGINIVANELANYDLWYERPGARRVLTSNCNQVCVIAHRHVN